MISAGVKYDVCGDQEQGRSQKRVEGVHLGHVGLRPEEGRRCERGRSKGSAQDPQPIRPTLSDPCADSEDGPIQQCGGRGSEDGREQVATVRKVANRHHRGEQLQQQRVGRIAWGMWHSEGVGRRQELAAVHAQVVPAPGQRRRQCGQVEPERRDTDSRTDEQGRRPNPFSQHRAIYYRPPHERNSAVPAQLRGRSRRCAATIAPYLIPS